MGFSHCLPNIYREKNYIPDYSVKKERRTGQSRLKNQSTLSPSFSSLLFFCRSHRYHFTIRQILQVAPPPKKSAVLFYFFFTGNGDLFLYFGGGTHRLLLLFWVVGGSVCAGRACALPFQFGIVLRRHLNGKKKKKRVFAFFPFFRETVTHPGKKYETRDTQRCKKIFL